MNKYSILEAFIQNFILKEKRERSLFELTHVKKRSAFINKLNHNWATIIDMRKMKSISKDSDVYSFIQMNLKIKDDEQVYLISNYDDVDDMVMDFKQAFNKTWKRGLATLIISISDNKMYLETEQIQGSAERFIGIL